MEHAAPISRRYGVAVGSTVLALLVTWVVRPLPTPVPGLILLTAVVGSAVYGGPGPGLLATACSLAVLHTVVLPPTYVMTVPITHGVRLGLFGAVACTIIVPLAVARLVTARLQRANAELEARVAERTATLSDAHEALTASEARYRELFENATDAIYTHDLQGRFTSVNRAGERLSGYTLAEVLQLNIAQVVVPEHLETANRTTEQQLAGKTPPPYELEILTKDGRRVPLELHTRLMVRDGQPVGIQGIARDISERRRAEEALRHAKEAAEAADRAKSEFLATMSHELRTPLSVIVGYTSILLDEGATHSEQERLDALHRIDRNAHELLDLITAVLDMSRLQAGRLPIEVSEVDVQDLLTEVRSDTTGLRDQSGLAFVWEAIAPLPKLRTDPQALKIVLKNLLGNAVKFTERGTITVRAESRAGGVDFSVRDTGIGIPPEALALVFEPFHQVGGRVTARSGGTGLGLSIVQRLILLLGGTVSVESQLGRGSTFRVWVPPAVPGREEKPAAGGNTAAEGVPWSEYWAH